MTSTRKNTAVLGVGAQDGGRTTEAITTTLQAGQCRTARPVSSLKLVELRSDDGHLVGWIPFAEAVAEALANIAERVR